MQRKQFERKLIQLFFEQRNLSEQISNLGYEKLDPPVQRGWKRFFVLRKDIARSDDALFFQKLLDKINTIEYSSRKDFKVKRRRLEKKITSKESSDLSDFFIMISIRLNLLSEKSAISIQLRSENCLERD